MEAMRVPWSDLPKELVENISKFLKSHIDILHIRAVCNSWSSAIPLNFEKFPSLPLIKLPIPDMIHAYNEESEFYLIESTVYLLQLPHPPHTGWLVKIVKTLEDFGDQCRGNCIYYENGGIIVDILGELPPKYYDDDFEDDCVCGGNFSYPILVDGGVKISNNDDKIDKNELGSKSAGGLSEELKLRYKELHGHHTGIFTLQDGKLGSLLSFLEYADIFWPPPSWLYIDDQADSSDARN